MAIPILSERRLLLSLLRLPRLRPATASATATLLFMAMSSLSSKMDTVRPW